MTTLREHRLDLRDFQDIVDEARKLIPRYCPEWTDHNVSDPGITLLELFAWMTEMILYQLNRVPDEMYERLLELIGLQIRPPEPAVAEVTFFLTAPRAVTVPAETAVATDRTEMEEAIVFSTVQDLVIAQPESTYFYSYRAAAQNFLDIRPQLTASQTTAQIFSDNPIDGDALYIGFKESIAGKALLLRFDCVEDEAAHIDPRRPPLDWEYRSLSGEWRDLVPLDESGTGRLRNPMADDPTRGLNRKGDVYVFVPTDATHSDESGVESNWLRVRCITQQHQRYTTSPIIRSVEVYCIGATVLAGQSQVIEDEYLGKSDGEPGQAFTLNVSPVLRSKEPHIVEAQLNDEISEWVEVEDFAASSETDHHFVIHYPTGEVRFGPPIRARDGTKRTFGAVPRSDSILRMRSYRTGGGTIGNVGEGTITQLRSSVPNIASLTNYMGSTGGLNQETMDEAKLRALGLLRRSSTAVTARDYEQIALEIPGVSMARCLPAVNANPGTVTLGLVPAFGDPELQLDRRSFELSDRLIAEVTAELDERKSLGTIVRLQQVELRVAEVDAHIFIRAGANSAAVQATAERRLRALFAPQRGAVRGSHLGFGAIITESQIAGILQGLSDVVYIERVRLRAEGNQTDVTRLQAPPDGLLMLGRCLVRADVVDA